MAKEKVLEGLQIIVTDLAQQADGHQIQSRVFASEGFTKLADKYAEHAEEERGYVQQCIDRILDLGGEVKLEAKKEGPVCKNPIDWIKYDLEVSKNGLAWLAELTEAGVTFPIKVLMPYNPGSSGWDEECQVIEQQMEELFGPDYIDIIVEAGPSTGFLSEVRRSGKYAFLKCNWGPDYSDPQTFTDPFTPGNSYQFAYKNADMDAVMQEYYDLVEKANAIYNDLKARYLAYADVEAYLINHAIIVPYGFSTGGYTASRIDPFTSQYPASLLAVERYKGSVLLDAPMSTDQYFDAYDQWLTERDALVTE